MRCAANVSKIGTAVLIISALLFAPAAVAKAQVSGDSVSGSVTNLAGTALPNAQVTFREIGSGANRVVVTDTAGFYTAPYLAPGTYEMTVALPGFIS